MSKQSFGLMGLAFMLLGFAIVFLVGLSDGPLKNRIALTLVEVCFAACGACYAMSVK